MQKCRLLAGATLAAAKSLLSGKFKIAINWQGGWHHARKTAAAGFCYVNDINIAIRYILKSTFYTKRVLYIDLDLHHGDGVESEFHKLRQVVTLSLHHFSDGFYPGTGSMSSQTGYAINVPLPEKVGDGDWTELATFAVTKAVDSFDPEYFVVQCGADSLFNDPHKTLCISQDAYFNVLARIKRFGKPTLVLGGGGYNEVATAKLWPRVNIIIEYMYRGEWLTRTTNGHLSQIKTFFKLRSRVLGVLKLGSLSTITKIFSRAVRI